MASSLPWCRGLYYRIEPAGAGRWQVTEVVEDAEGRSEDTYLLDGFGLQDGEEVLLPPSGTREERRLGAKGLPGASKVA